MSKQTARHMPSITAENSTLQKQDLSHLPKELGTLLQIDLLLGRTQDFNNRLSKALCDLAEIASTGERSIKH